MAKWTEADKQIMYDHYPTVGAAGLTETLDRTREAVQMQASRMDIKYEGPHTEHPTEKIKTSIKASLLGFIRTMLASGDEESIRAIASHLFAKAAEGDERASQMILQYMLPPARTWDSVFEKEEKTFEQKYQRIKSRVEEELQINIETVEINQ